MEQKGNKYFLPPKLFSKILIRNRDISNLTHLKKKIRRATVPYGNFSAWT